MARTLCREIFFLAPLSTLRYSRWPDLAAFGRFFANIGRATRNSQHVGISGVRNWPVLAACSTHRQSRCPELAGFGRSRETIFGFFLTNGPPQSIPPRREIVFLERPLSPLPAAPQNFFLETPPFVSPAASQFSFLMSPRFLHDFFFTPLTALFSSPSTTLP
jgi:hypothetical protein